MTRIRLAVSLVLAISLVALICTLAVCGSPSVG
jgi:hypothetical protein